MTDKKELRRKLWELHEALIDHFVEQLSNGEDLTGSTLDAMRGFLKDNAITRNELKRANSMDSLAEVLSEWNEEVDPVDEVSESNETDDNDQEDSDDDMNQGFRFAQ
jgi:hypothetical protein